MDADGRRRVVMFNENLVGIANCRYGTLDLWDAPDDSESVVLPKELAESADSSEISTWAARSGHIRQGELVAVSTL